MEYRKYIKWIGKIILELKINHQIRSNINTRNIGMSCNTSKCKELCMAKGVTPNFPPLCGIEQSDSCTLLGVTLQNDCKFSSHVKGKLREANKCLYILRSLRKDGYTQVEVDHLFKAIVLPKITYALPVYGASQVDLNTIQCFLKRCNKQLYTFELINIYDLLEKRDRRLFTKIKNNVNHHYMPFCRKSKSHPRS